MTKHQANEVKSMSVRPCVLCILCFNWLMEHLLSKKSLNNIPITVCSLFIITQTWYVHVHVMSG